MLTRCPTCKIDFQTKDKRQKFCSKSCYHKSISGSAHHHSGDKMPMEIREKARIARKARIGEKNHFFGKHHTEETKQKIREANRKYREKHSDKFINLQLDLWNLSREKVKDIFYEYKDTYETKMSLGAKYKIDGRTLSKYFIILGYCTKEELRKIAEAKQCKNNTSVPEETLYLLLCVVFGSDNIIRQYKIERYRYDFLIHNKLLVEYDGWYWHQIQCCNDEIKDDLAKEKGFTLYRVLEPDGRKTDLLAELQKIKEVFNEI